MVLFKLDSKMKDLSHIQGRDTLSNLLAHVEAKLGGNSTQGCGQRKDTVIPETKAALPHMVPRSCCVNNQAQSTRVYTSPRLCTTAGGRMGHFTSPSSPVAVPKGPLVTFSRQGHDSGSSKSIWVRMNRK